MNIEVGRVLQYTAGRVAEDIVVVAGRSWAALVGDIVGDIDCKRTPEELDNSAAIEMPW